MRGIKIPQYEFAPKMQGGLCTRGGGGGAYLRHTTVLVSSSQVKLFYVCSILYFIGNKSSK